MHKAAGTRCPGAFLTNGARVPGTDWQLDPVQAAFNIGAMIRWLDFNDTWLAAEWGHPSDNLGGILALADYLCRTGRKSLTIGDVLHAMIKAHEIQGILALENSFNRVGLDHVLLVRVATAAVCTARSAETNNKSSAPSPTPGPTAAACASIVTLQIPARANHGPPATPPAEAFVWHSWHCKVEMGYPSALSAKTWGFYDVLFNGKRSVYPDPLGAYVMENVLFKISFPAEFHAQTAVECAIQLHEEVKNRLDQIERIKIITQESAIRIIDKTGPLHNPADRDHCIQYMIAVGLIFGELTADHYEDDVARDPRIDSLRDKMIIIEDARYSEDYLDPEKRSIANAVQVFFKDGSATEKIAVEYPIGHRRRRAEGIPLLIKKFEAHLNSRLAPPWSKKILDLCLDLPALQSTAVDQFTDMFAVQPA